MPSSGGGISCRSSASPVIVGNLIAYNLGPSAGGGIYCHTSCSPLIANNCIVGNDVANATGGAIYIGYSSDPTVINNTICKNSALNYGAIFSYSSNPLIINSISRNNYPNEIGGSVTVTYCNVEGGFTGTGNIDADPLFVDSAGNDFHLTWDSPCRDTGDNSAVTELHDFEGDPRIALGTVDMGADEFYFHLYHSGDVIPGSPIEVKVVGDPGGTPVRLALGSGVQDPPQSTPYGNLYLILPPVKTFSLGTIPQSGVLVMQAKVPASWQSGKSYPLQALVGPLGNPASVLTNLMVLTVE
jgi:parallel beta-helix repeat protein